eukprot:TRINITY_DN19205_c0_g1_i1.p1 TRINITY_DN19205_c0_g1~~TRINITY_DN19205_c0_g1_i1.p1  ORF type:complete len:330 (-),score=58.46 TRINITY_DN19205_c0_g1_i1:467-1456(-)
MVEAVFRHQVWPSENRFHCGGRGISGPDRKQFWFSVFLLWAPEIAFLGSVIPDLLQRYPWAPAVLAVNVYLFLLCAISMMIAAFKDPGIIPRGPKPSIDEDPMVFARTYPETKEVVVDGVRLIVKFCNTCRIYRPPRATHCGICENCVDKFDHHCPYLGNCVGRRNYSYFLVFIYTVFINAAYIAAFSALELTTTTIERDSLADGIAHAPGSLACGLYAVAALLAISVLAFMHCYLIATNTTTNESIKQTWQKQRNPFSLGFFGNFLIAFCPPSYARFVNPFDRVGPDGAVVHPQAPRGHHNACVCTRHGGALIELPDTAPASIATAPV